MTQTCRGPSADSKVLTFLSGKKSGKCLGGKNRGDLRIKKVLEVGNLQTRRLEDVWSFPPPHYSTHTSPFILKGQGNQREICAPFHGTLRSDRATHERSETTHTKVTLDCFHWSALKNVFQTSPTACTVV